MTPVDVPRILSLCSGFGGLDLVVEKLTGGRLVAYAEKMPAASKVMAHHWPDVPNLGGYHGAEVGRSSGRVRAAHRGRRVPVPGHQ